MLTAHPVPGKQKSIDLCAAFIAGAPKDAKGFVFYGVTGSNHSSWLKALHSRLPYYFIDNSYFDCVRGQQFRVTKNAIQVHGARDLQSDGSRFAALNLTLQPWQGNLHGHTLIIEQSPVFMKLTAREPNWLRDVLRTMRSGDKFRVRKWANDKLKLQASLADDLVGAKELVTHTSAAAVTAVLLGVPVTVSPLHALHGMQPHERQHFLNVLADNQWSISELKDGSAYRWLNR